MDLGLKPVESSNVAAVGYDHNTQLLNVQFKSGKKVYQYKKVPPELYAQLQKADSVGKYISRMVVGKFDHVTIDIK